MNITIIDDEVFEEDEHFYVQLSNIRVCEEGQRMVQSEAVELANPSMATIMVLDDDHCGIFHFDSKAVEVSEACGIASVKVFRSSGKCSRVWGDFDVRRMLLKMLVFSLILKAADILPDFALNYNIINYSL